MRPSILLTIGNIKRKPVLEENLLFDKNSPEYIQRVKNWQNRFEEEFNYRECDDEY